MVMLASAAEGKVFSQSLRFSLSSWSPYWALLWAEDTRSSPLLIRHPVHGFLHGQRHSQRRLLGKLQCLAKQCFRRSVCVHLAKPCGKYSLFLLRYLRPQETLKTRFVNPTVKCFFFSFKWFLCISIGRTIGGGGCFLKKIISGKAACKPLKILGEKVVSGKIVP